MSAAEAGEKVGSLKASTAGVPADAVLRLGRGLAEQLISVRERSGLPIHIHDMYQKDEDEVLETVDLGSMGKKKSYECSRRFPTTVCSHSESMCV